MAEVALWVLREGSAGADTSAGQPGTGMLRCPFYTLMDRAQVAHYPHTTKHPWDTATRPRPTARPLVSSPGRVWGPSPGFTLCHVVHLPGKRRPGQFSFPTLLIKASRNRSGCFHPKAVRTARQREGRVKCFSLIWLH